MSYLPEDAYLPAEAALRCCRNCRDQARYLAVVAQFDVERTPRYQPREGKTYCNIFASDVAAAMGCLLPHWWLGRELTVNDLVPWLRKTGTFYGWEQLGSAHVATGAVLAGMFTVATWVNKAGPGHIAVLLPVPTDDDAQPWIAQAGRSNFAHARLAAGFGSHLSEVEFYTCK